MFVFIIIQNCSNIDKLRKHILHSANVYKDNMRPQKPHHPTHFKVLAQRSLGANILTWNLRGEMYHNVVLQRNWGVQRESLSAEYICSSFSLLMDFLEKLTKSGCSTRTICIAFTLYHHFQRGVLLGIWAPLGFKASPPNPHLIRPPPIIEKPGWLN